MLFWVLLGVLLGLAGLAVLALLGVRLFRQVRDFSREVAAAGEKLATASAELQRATSHTP